MEGILDIKTVHQCNCCLGSKTLHPQASVIRLGENTDVRQHSIRFDFYTVLLIDNHSSCGCTCCGRKYYDYSDASMVFLSPEKAFDMNRQQALPDKGWLLAFHPDLLYGTSLCHSLCNYTFFSYSKEEALHLSLREKNKIIACFETIDEELHYPIDIHSRTIITRLIELLLDYCKRYYGRQFITREDKNNMLMEQFNIMVDEYIAQGRMSQGVFPSAEVCARNLNLSPQYFKDLLKLSTGKTMSEFMELKRIDTAKSWLALHKCTPMQIAIKLGYPSTQQFSTIFKKITSYCPNEYMAHN